MYALKIYKFIIQFRNDLNFSEEKSISIVNFKQRSKFIICLVLSAILLSGILSGCSAEKRTTSVNTISQLKESGRKIGVSVDTPEEALVREDFPDAEIVLMDSINAYTQVANGKLDAYIYSRDEMKVAINNGVTGIRLLDEDYCRNQIGVGLSEVSKIPSLKEKINNFISELRTNGTLDDMYDRWVVKGDYTMPKISLPENPSFNLIVGTTGTVMPYSYYVGNKLNGYDIELAYRFAAWLGAGLEFKVFDFSGMITAAKTGDVDCIMSNLYWNEERAESIDFSDLLFEVVVTAAVRDESTASSALSLDDMKTASIGVLTGSNFNDILAGTLPNAEIVYFNSTADQVNAVKSGKVDALAVDEPVGRNMVAEDGGLDMIPEQIGAVDYAYALGKSERQKKICGELSEYIRGLKADGTLEKLQKKWVDSKDISKVESEDYSELPDTNGTIRLAAYIYPPFVVNKEEIYAGYEVELMAKFCREKGYALEVTEMKADAILQSVITGKCDAGCCGISITEERKESVLFSEPEYSGGTVLLVKKGNAETPEFTEFSQLNGKIVSMLEGAPFEEMIRSKVPNVGELSYYTTMTDMVTALQAEKTDAILMNNAVSALAVNRSSGIAEFPQKIQESTYGLAFAKGSSERKVWQEAYDTISKDDLDAIWDKWTGSDESKKVIPAQDWPGENGTITAAVCDSMEPACYAGADGELIGFEVEIILKLAEKLDVHVEFVGMSFSAIMSYVQSGKALLGAGTIIVTPERAEAVDFIEYYPSAFVLVVRTADTQEGDGSFWSSVATSFEKTFIRENRWQLFVYGIVVTLLITVLSIIFGTILGFAVFMLCRGGNPVANTITRFCVWLVEGMPVVVLLMILYYIIFGKVQISGTLVAIIGFTLIFGAAVFGMLKTGVGAVDKGQSEAAVALGYSSKKAFFRVVLPQALPHVMPSYLGQITALIKATAIVGYIAVQDLTKMADIVRSRTYEAFFPLIAIAVIYFILAGMLSFIVKRISRKFIQGRRNPETDLKGVVTHD